MIKLRDYQEEAIGDIEAHIALGSNNITLQAETSFGKEQPYYEKILTPTGWVQMGSLNVGDKVIGSNGLPINITHIHEQGEKRIYKVIFEDNSSVDCGLEHLWNVKIDENKIETLSVKDLMPMLNRTKEIFIPLAEATEIEPDDKIDLDPYIFGIVIANGNLFNDKIELFFSKEKDAIEASKKIIDKDSNFFIKKETINEEDIYSLSLFGSIVDKFKAIIDSSSRNGSKYLPLEAMKESIYFRKKMLKGIKYGSRVINPGGYIRIEHKKAALSIVNLARSLGYQSWLKTAGQSTNFKYSIGINQEATFKRIKRIDNLGFSFKSRCITVDAEDSLYITNGYNLTHNSITMSQLAKNHKNKKVIILVNIETLIDQIAFFLKELDVDYSILKAGRESEFDNSKNIQLVMSQTYYARIDKMDLEAEILVIDEAHREYQTKRINTILDKLQPEYRIGFTATPYDEKGFLLQNTELISTVTTQELTDKGYLSPIKYYSALWSEKVDYSKVSKSGSDYNLKEMNEITLKAEHIQKTIESMDHLYAKEKKTIIFCSNIDQANVLTDMLKQNGYKAFALHSSLDNQDIDNIMTAFRENTEFKGFKKDLNNSGLFEDELEPQYVKCLVSVSKLAVGFSVEDIDLGVVVRASRVRSYWAQMAGRMRRTYKGLDILLDKIKKQTDDNYSRKIAFVASIFERDKSKIEKQLSKKKINNIDVYEHGSTINEDEYDIIEYNVRPNKEIGEVLDLGQCISEFGLPEEEYIPPTRTGNIKLDKEVISQANKEKEMKNIEAVLNKDNFPEAITRQKYLKRIEEIESNSTKLTSLTVAQLIDVLTVSDNIDKLIASTAVILDRVYCKDMKNGQGKAVRGYISCKGKVVQNFMNPNAIGWISEHWKTSLENESNYYKAKYTKALKTRLKNIIRNKDNIWAVRFFIDYLLEKDEMDKAITNSQEETGFKVEIEKSDGSIEIIEDHEIPF